MATSSRDSSLIELQTKQTELEKYTALNDLTSDYKILQTKLNETLGLLALKDIDIKEGLKTKTYEISVVNQKHDELVKKSLLTRSQFEGQLKEKTKVISDLKVKEGKDIDTMIEMDKQIKFLNEILYKRNQSIQTIHMLAPKCATYHGRSTFANPKYLKKAQSDKPRLYEIPYDTSDPANRFCPDGEETEIDELESEKADFSNIYDLLLEECVSKDVTCSYLHSLSESNAHTELKCMYLHKVKECECLAQKLSKQTESVNNEVHNKLLKSFAKLEKHSISLELSLQHCKEQMKNNPVCKDASMLFRKGTVKNSVETQFDKPSVVRQPNAQRIPKPSVLGKPTPFSNSPEMRSFQTNKSVNKTNASDGLFKPVTQQNLPQNRNQAVRNTNVLKPGMYRIASTTTQTRTPQLPHASRNTNPHMSKSSGVIHTTSVSRPQLKCYQVKDKFISRTSNENVVCAECGTCVFNSNHDACVSRYLKDMNARTKKPNVVPISASKPKRKANKSVATPHKKTVASDTTIQKSKSYYKKLYENTNQEWRWWIAKRCPSDYTWTQKPLRTKKIWMPKIRKDDESTSISPTIDIVSRITNVLKISNSLGSNLSNVPSSSNSLADCTTHPIHSDQASVFMEMTSVHISSGLVLHQMTSDHNRSELGIQDHSNEPSSSKLVPKVVPLAVKTTTSRQELELLFHLHIAMLRTKEYVSQAAAANFNQGNTGYRASIANQIRPPGFPPVQQNQGNNQNRYNQNRGNNYNQGQIYRPPINQPPVHQAPPYQAPAPQTQGVSKDDFQNYVKANDAVMRNMQNQNQNLQNQMTNLTDMLSKFVNSKSSYFRFRALPCQLPFITLKVDLEGGITTRSGVAYQGPTIPTTSSPPKVVERETEVTKDTVPPTNNGSTKDVQPPVVQVQPQVPNSEPVVAPVSAPKPNPKPSISYPSRLNDQKIREKVNNQIEKFYQIFQDLHFAMHIPLSQPLGSLNRNMSICHGDTHVILFVISLEIC
ncbi:hypothetical protein Tco_0002021 [Tanacetum coccineum]